MSSDKQRQIQQYQNMDWGRMDRQISGMTAGQKFDILSAMLAEVPEPLGAQRNQGYEIDYIAQQTGTGKRPAHQEVGQEKR